MIHTASQLVNPRRGLFDFGLLFFLPRSIEMVILRLAHHLSPTIKNGDELLAGQNVAPHTIRLAADGRTITGDQTILRCPLACFCAVCACVIVLEFLTHFAPEFFETCYIHVIILRFAIENFLNFLPQSIHALAMLRPPLPHVAMVRAVAGTI